MNQWRRRLRQGRHPDEGAAAVEFVLVLPILLLVLFAIVDFGRFLHTRLELAEAAREGVRAAALADDLQAQERIDAVLAGLADDTDVTITTCVDADPGQAATVVLTYTFDFVTPLGFGGDDGQTTLTETAVMACM